MSENITKSSGKFKMLLIVALSGIIGVALILFSGNGKKSDANNDVSQDPYADASAYADEIEKQIEELCRGVIGAGDIKVFVSLKGGYRTVYAVDAQSSSSGYKSEVVMSGSGSGETPLVTAYENPEISGVGIVCSGGSDPNVRKEIIDLVSAALNISSNKIFVTSGE